MDFLCFYYILNFKKNLNLCLFSSIILEDHISVPDYCRQRYPAKRTIKRARDQDLIEEIDDYFKK